MFKNYNCPSEAFRLHAFFTGPKRFCLASGGGGCGKSYAIAAWLENSGLDRSEYVFVAPTGKAVSVAEEKGMNGRTIHSYFKLLNNDTFTSIDRHIQMKWGAYAKYVAEIQKELIGKKVVVVDEISMVNNQMLPFILELIMETAPRAKIILAGDYHQLGAVIPDSKRFDNPDIDESLEFVFDLIKAGEVDVIEFNTRYRSSDETYNEWLHNMRYMVDPSLRDMVKFADSIQSFFNVHDANVPEDVENTLTYLCHTNARVKEINDHILGNVTGNKKPIWVRAQMEVNDIRYSNLDDVKRRDMNAYQILKEMQFVEEVPLVEGAKILFLTNNVDLYRNGEEGTIQEIKGSTVKIMKHTVHGDFPIEIEKHTYESDDNDKEMGLNIKVVQWPFTLGYARSTHKAQGDGFLRPHLDFTEIMDNRGMSSTEKWRLIYVQLSRVIDPKQVWISTHSLEKLRSNRKMLNNVNFDRLSLNYFHSDVSKPKYIPRKVM